MAVFGETMPKNSPVQLGRLYRLGNLQGKGLTGQFDEETQMRIRQSSCLVVQSLAGPAEICKLRRRLFGTHVVCGQRFLIANIEAATRNNRMSPTWTPVAFNLESPLFHVFTGARIHQGNFVVFAEQIQHSVSSDECSLADTAVLPHGLAGQEIHADQGAATIGVHVAADLHDSAVVAVEFLFEIDFIGGERVIGICDLRQTTARPIGTGSEYEVLINNRRTAIGGSVCRLLVFPQELSVLDRHAKHAGV